MPQRLLQFWSEKRTGVVVVDGAAMAHQHSCKLAKNTVYMWSRGILPQPLGSSVVCQADRSQRKWKCKLRCLVQLKANVLLSWWCCDDSQTVRMQVLSQGLFGGFTP